MVLYFITKNKGKFKEARDIIPETKQFEFDLEEIQELDAKKIIEKKIKEAVKYYKGKFFCEDTSIYLNCLNGFPGPLIKWLIDAIGNEGIFKLVDKYEDKTAIARTIIGYYNGKEIKFFEGILEGEIVKPKGKEGFGWDPIFQPKGYEKTLGEMTLDEKNKISMRKKALEKLKEYLKNRE